METMTQSRFGNGQTVVPGRSLHASGREENSSEKKKIVELTGDANNFAQSPQQESTAQMRQFEPIGSNVMPDVIRVAWVGEADERPAKPRRAPQHHENFWDNTDLNALPNEGACFAMTNKAKEEKYSNKKKNQPKKRSYPQKKAQRKRKGPMKSKAQKQSALASAKTFPPVQLKSQSQSSSSPVESSETPIRNQTLMEPVNETQDQQKLGALEKQGADGNCKPRRKQKHSRRRNNPNEHQTQQRSPYLSRRLDNNLRLNHSRQMQRQQSPGELERNDSRRRNQAPFSKGPNGRRGQQFSPASHGGWDNESLRRRGPPHFDRHLAQERQPHPWQPPPPRFTHHPNVGSCADDLSRKDHNRREQPARGWKRGRQDQQEDGSWKRRRLKHGASSNEKKMFCNKTWSRAKEEAKKTRQPRIPPSKKKSHRDSRREPKKVGKPQQESRSKDQPTAEKGSRIAPGAAIFGDQKDVVFKAPPKATVNEALVKANSDIIQDLKPVGNTKGVEKAASVKCSGTKKTDNGISSRACVGEAKHSSSVLRDTQHTKSSSPLNATDGAQLSEPQMPQHRNISLVDGDSPPPSVGARAVESQRESYSNKEDTKEKSTDVFNVENTNAIDFLSGSCERNKRKHTTFPTPKHMDEEDKELKEERQVAIEHEAQEKGTLGFENKNHNIPSIQSASSRGASVKPKRQKSDVGGIGEDDRDCEAGSKRTDALVAAPEQSKDSSLSKMDPEDERNVIISENRGESRSNSNNPDTKKHGENVAGHARLQMSDDEQGPKIVGESEAFPNVKKPGGSEMESSNTNPRAKEAKENDGGTVKQTQLPSNQKTGVDHSSSAKLRGVLEPVESHSKEPAREKAEAQGSVEVSPKSSSDPVSAAGLSAKSRCLNHDAQESIFAPIHAMDSNAKVADLHSESSVGAGGFNIVSDAKKEGPRKASAAAHTSDVRNFAKVDAGPSQLSEAPKTGIRAKKLEGAKTLTGVPHGLSRPESNEPIVIDSSDDEGSEISRNASANIKKVAHGKQYLSKKPYKNRVIDLSEDVREGNSVDKSIGTVDKAARKSHPASFTASKANAPKRPAVIDLSENESCGVAPERTGGSSSEGKPPSQKPLSSFCSEQPRTQKWSAAAVQRNVPSRSTKRKAPDIATPSVSRPSKARPPPAARTNAPNVNFVFSREKFRTDVEYSYNFSQSAAQMEQERLFREARARAVQARSAAATRVGIPVFTRPVEDISKLRPDHYKWPNPYARLGLPPGCPVHIVKRQYRRFALAYHPDKSKLPDTATRFQAVTEAYKSLTRT